MHQQYKKWWRWRKKSHWRCVQTSQWWCIKSQDALSEDNCQKAENENAYSLTLSSADLMGCLCLLLLPPDSFLFVPAMWAFNSRRRPGSKEQLWWKWMKVGAWILLTVFDGDIHIETCSFCRSSLFYVRCNFALFFMFTCCYLSRPVHTWPTKMTKREKKQNQYRNNTALRTQPWETPG